MFRTKWAGGSGGPREVVRAAGRTALRCALAGLAAAVAWLAPCGGAGESRAADDWPQWRGPKRDAVSAETGLLKKWPAGGPKLAWELKGLGKGLSTVAIVGGRLYTMGNHDGQYIMAYDLADRKLVWKAKVGPANDQPHATPTVDGDRVYALGTAGDLVCVTAADGKEIWRKSLTRDFGGKVPKWKFSESVLVDGDRLIATPGGPEAVMVAFNKKTGDVIWKCAPAEVNEAGAAAYASAVVSEGAGVRQYVTLTSRGVIGVEADNGKLLWVYHRVANRTANIPTPVVEGDFVFVSTAYKAGSALLKLAKAGDGVKAEEVYFLPASTFQCHHGGFLLAGGCIYGADGHNQGNPISIEMATGKVAWREKQLGKGSGSLVYADGHLYYRWEDDTVALIAADPARYTLDGSFKIPRTPGADGPGWAHPVVHDGKLYIRHGDVLFCYEVKAG